MKNFAEKHVTVILFSAVILLCATLFLTASLVFVSRSVNRKAESELILNRAEYENTVKNLRESIYAGDDRLAYHYAADAAENAARIGENDAAIMFAQMAEKLLTSPEIIRELGQTVDKYIKNGEISTLQNSVEEERENTIKAVALARIEEAQKCVERLFGEHNSLKMEMKSRNGEIIFSCSNAYAVVDSRTGLPIEAAVSLMPAENKLDADACTEYAMIFLKENFPRVLAELAEVTDIHENNLAGTFEISLRANDRSIFIAVRRDSGRISRLVAR